MRSGRRGAPNTSAATPSGGSLTRRGFGAVAAAALVARVPLAHADAQPAQPDILGTIRRYRVQQGQSLFDVTRATDLGLVELMAANPGVDMWLPKVGTDLLLPTARILPAAPRRGIVINLVEMRLYFFAADGSLKSTHPIGIGREAFTTPLGTTTVVQKVVNPVWRPTAGERADDPNLPAVVPPGPKNPMGAFALYLGWPTYGIHGTNRPAGIGMRVSRGCIRMFPKDIASLFPQVEVGTPVTVVDEQLKLGRRDGAIYLEAQPDRAQADELIANGKMTPVDVPDFSLQVARFAGDAFDSIDLAAAALKARKRSGYPVRITS